jgi:glycosyltransferase involved in cell wall biosynthesis
MKVAIDLKNLWLYGKGIGTFTLNLLHDLAVGEMPPSIQLQLHSPSFENKELDFVKNNPRFQQVITGTFDKKSRLAKLNYDQRVLLKSLAHRQSDVLFSPYFDVPFLWNKPMITTIHDLSILERKQAYGKAFYLYYKTLLQKAVKSSQVIVTVSNYSKDKIIETFGIGDDRVKIIHNKIHPSFLNSRNQAQGQTAKIKARYNLPDEFILYTGGLEARKNIDLLINGIASARRKYSAIPPLVITGVSPGGISSAYKDLMKKDAIILLGYLPYDDIVSLYSLATLIVNTSSYEGFGIPVLEALTLQKPLLCSDIPVYKEIGKGYVHYFKNNDRESFEEQLLLFFSGKFASFQHSGMAGQAAYFNSKNYSETFFQLINQCL